jgi:VanZ family protein
MYQVIAVRGGETLDLIVVLRNWCRPLWGLFVVLWLAVLAALFVIYIDPAAAPPTTTIPGLNVDIDKAFHIIAHAGTIALPLVCVPVRWLAWVMVAAAVFCGFAFEFAQFFVSARTFDLADLTANFAGLTVGARAGRFVRELYPRVR